MIGTNFINSSFLFFELVVSKGMVTIDDYNHWNGCKKVVDEYLATINKVELHIIILLGQTIKLYL